MNRIIAIALFAGATFPMASGATAQGHVIEVDVPFSFTVNNTFLPAGRYTFGSDSKHPDLLIVRDGVDHLKAMDLGQRGLLGPGKPAVLIFHRYGDQYFLSEVRFDSPSSGIFLPAAKPEKQARKEGATEDLATVAIH